MTLRVRALLFAGLGALPVALAGCGFTPLYADATESGVSQSLREVSLGQVAGPVNAQRFMIRELENRLPGAALGEPGYRLDVSLRDTRRAVAVTVSSATTRFDYTLRARYTLTDLATGERHTSNVQSLASYGVVESQYASFKGREDSIRRASIDLARKIELDVALFLAGRPVADRTVDLPEEIEDGVLDGATLSDPGTESTTIGPDAEPQSAPEMEGELAPEPEPGPQG